MSLTLRKLQQSQFRSGSIFQEELLNILTAQHSHLTYHPPHFFYYPFTLISHPKRSLISRPIEQPAAYQVYCPLSCKKVKIGAVKGKDKEGVEFNTTSNRWVTAIFNQNIKYLINGHPPNKKDKKKIQGKGWSFWTQVTDKGNFAIFNPYTTIPNEPLSLYTFDQIPQVEKEIVFQDKFVANKYCEATEIVVNGKSLYLHQNEAGSFLGTNRFFNDLPTTSITLVNPKNSNQSIYISTDEALQIVTKNKHFWLKQLNKQIQVEKTGAIIITEINFNLDIVFEKLNFYLNLEEQIRAKLMSTAGATKLSQKFGYHPRLYSGFSRLASFINYGNTKYDTQLLAELGFYNKSDMLQDLAFFEFSEIPISSPQSPSYTSQHDLRRKLFPFSRLQRQLPIPNVSIQTTISSLLHQSVSRKHILHRQVNGQYLMLIDTELNLTLWSCKLFPVKIYEGKLNSQEVKQASNLLTEEAELVDYLTNVEKDEAPLVSLFEEAPAPPKEVKPVEILPDQSMFEQMQNMGYGVGVIKKALIAVKNQSVAAAIDAIDQLVANDKKKKVQQRKEWSCSACTYINKSSIDTCQMCGQICEVVDEAENERLKLQQQAELEKERLKQEERLKVEREKQQERLKKEQQQLQKLRIQKQKEQRLLQSQLKAVKLYIRKASPLDPFIIVMLFWNSTLQKSYLKVIRIGISRTYLSKFYKIQEKMLITNVKRTLLPVNFAAFETVVRQSTEQIQWGLKLIEPSNNQQWIITDLKEVELPTQCLTIKSLLADNLTIGCEDSNNLYFKVVVNDSVKQSSFDLVKTENHQQSKDQVNCPQEQKQLVKEIDEGIQIKNGQQFQLQESVSQVIVQVVEHLPSGQWLNRPASSQGLVPSARFQGEVVMNQFLPLSIEHFQGSVFSCKHYSTTILQKSSNLFISNYPITNFTLKHNSGKHMFIESAVIVSSSKRIQRIFSIFEGLIFTANEPTWFHIAKQRFINFNKEDYKNWLTNKKSLNEPRQFWQPVGFFEIQNQAEIELEYKRSAKYIFLLPTTVKNVNQKKKDQVFAVKLDFFGVKGRVEEEKTYDSFVSNFKNQGSSKCQILLFNSTSEGLQPVDASKVIIKSSGHVNTYTYLPNDITIYQKMPLSTTTITSFKIRNNNSKKVIKVNSQFAQKIKIRLSRDVAQEVVEFTSITSFEELAKVQNQLTIPQIKKIVQSLEIKQLLRLVLQTEKNSNSYQTLLNKLEDSLDLKEKIFEGIIEFVPQLCEENIPATETGFKFLMTAYEKALPAHLQVGFQTNTEALKRITNYVKERRNKNYNLLRTKYNIEQLILESSLFSKDYYRLVYPNFIQEQPKLTASSEPTGTINNCLWIEQVTPYNYVEFIDLGETRRVESLRFFVPKIATNNFRCKLGLNIWNVTDQGDSLLYSRYYHEELLVQLGVNGFKDNQIYKGERLNCLTIHDLAIDARIIKVQITYLLITTQVHNKYKQIPQKFYLIPLVDFKPTTKEIIATKQLQLLHTTFPQQTRHLYCCDRLPPAKYYTDGSRSIFHIHDFPIVELAVVKRQYRELIDRITTNIMDENIVRESVKSIKISNYEFNRKGIDFAYSYLILIMNLNKKFPLQLHVSIDLLLQLFDTFVVFQAGPINKKAFGFIQESYKRLTNSQKAAFVDALINKYLSNIESLNNLKVSEKYSPCKVIEKLQQFELPVASLFNKLQKTNSKTLKLLLVKLIFTVIGNHGLGHLELYCPDTSKYTKQVTLYNLICSAFNVCLWILDNVLGIKEQAITQGLDLLLLMLDTAPDLAQQRPEALKQFMGQFKEKQLWKLVFLTLKLKSESLKERINKLFAVLTKNLTQKFRVSINEMLQQIIVKQSGSIYVTINPTISDQLWMNHLQTTLELITMTKDKLYLDNQIALKLLELPLTPTLWSLVLHIIPRNDLILVSIIQNFKKQYYNSLGKQITKFCEPLAGIRSLQSNHINWLDLVRKIRLEGKNVFELFIEQLQLTSFGGKEGLTMATVDEVKQLQITCEFVKLVLQDKTLKKQYFTQNNIRKLTLWYFLNKSKEKGSSPATDKILFLSQSIKSFFLKITQFPEIVKLCIKTLLHIREQSEVIERNYEEKRIPIHSALTLNKRCCQCFEELLGVFMTNDELCSYFAFQLNGLSHILKIMNINNQDNLSNKTDGPIFCPPDEELLLHQKLVATKVSQEQAPTEIKQLEELKEEEFANNVKLMPNLNLAGLSSSNSDWTVYKKGNKTKIIFLHLIDAQYYEYPLYLQFNKTVELRSIKIGFTAASYEFNDKLIVTPSSVVIEGSTDGANFQPIGEMNYLQDDAYIVNGVQVWVLNCQKMTGISSIAQSVKELGLHKLKYMKIIVKRPVVSFIQGSYSQLNGKCYNSLGCSISFLSVTGEDSQKLPFALLESCRQISKRSALNILSSLLNESNSQTMKKIANDKSFAHLMQSNFKKVIEYMTKYQQVMPNIVFLVGAGNKQLGDWIIQQFLRDSSGQIQSKIINQIITSTPQKAFTRLRIFLRSILYKLATIKRQTQIESGMLYAKEIHFMESFCKTLEECYQIGLPEGQLECSRNDIDNIISIYDSKHSSPQIKSLVKFLIYLLHIREPLRLSNPLTIPAMNLIWQNCSELKTHFYNLMAGLLIDRKAKAWIQDESYLKVDQLIKIIYSTISNSQFKNLKLQLFLLSQISYHEGVYLRNKQVHFQLYHRIKIINHQDSQIIDSVLKIVRNVVLGDKEEEQKVAKMLFDDVGLLVKRRDPFLQKLYVGMLGLQSEVMIHIGGLDIKSTKKEPVIASKYLTKKNQKALSEKINRKYKYSLLGEINGKIKIEDQQLFLKSFSCSSLLIIIRFKFNDNLYTCGVYSPLAGKRSEQGDYFWEEIISYDKNGFIFFLNEPENLFITSAKPEAKLGNIYGGDEQQQNAAVFYDESDEIIQFTFSSQQSVPKLSFSKYSKVLPEELCSSTLDNDTENYSLLGIQFWELKTPNTVNVSESKLSNLLSKSNHAKPPFSYYRHAPIYIFPANITLAKFMDILGLKGNCHSRGVTVKDEQTLVQLQQLSPDFIIDLDISSQQVKQDKQQINQIGYIPVMTIFNHFSRLEGVSEVLRLGADSIKDWKKADRKKNFEHYMDELRSFINLPNFFNLFIKNQQYVTLLFEVASGLPDDETSTKNWEEEYVNNFRFIYKIVSDIFKFDRSQQLRSMEKYADFVEVILQKLSEISKQAPRVLKEQQISEEQQINNLQLHKNKSQDRKRKKKGIGYGADNQNSSKWSASDWLEARKNVSQQTLRVISIMVSFMDCEEPLRDDRLTDIIKQSCLLPILESALRSGSLLDISKQSQLFKSYLQIVRLLAAHPSTIQCLLDLQKKYKPEQSQSIYSLLGKLNGIAEIFTECLKSGKDVTNNNEAAESIAIDIHRTHIVVDKAVKNLRKKGKGISIAELNSMPVAKAYRFLLEGHRFGYVNLKQGSGFKHAHSSSISNSTPSTSKILRLSQQLADLSSSLPCQHTNSIFVRCDKSRIDVINILIMGSKDTPYANGAFTFDVYCDDSYPNNPPKMLITTTGQGKIRFNPNLYSCGKVCLSLLGTWRGSASQNWDPKVSTLLQLFISTQGITMSDDVYFNQPGFEGEQGTDEGQKKNQAYSNIVRLGNVRYAMVGQLKNPPKGFEQVVKRHFYIKRKEIIEECEKWVEWAQKRQASYSGLVNDHNSSWCSQLKQSKTKYKELLVKQIDELKELLKNLPPPDLKQKEQEIEHNFASQKTHKDKEVSKQAKLQEVDVAYDKEQKQIKQYQEHVMHDRWSRYIGAMGLQAVKKQAESSVLLIGLKPLGLQIAKNLVLSGLKKLTIVQNETISGHQQHFYMSNLQGNQIKQCIFKIKQLNPYMLVDHTQTLPDVSSYSIVISTASYSQSKDISSICRKANIKFLYAETKGVSGVYFADLGLHEVNDDNGQEPFQGIIKNITCEQNGIVTLIDGVKHAYQDDDYVVFSKIEGMDCIKEVMQQKSGEQIFFQKGSNQKINGINNRVFRIKIINCSSFTIGDTRNFASYKANGLVRNIKIPKKIQFQSLTECEKEFDKQLDSNMGIYDFEKMGDNRHIFQSFQTLSEYQHLHKTLPQNWSAKDTSQFLKIQEQLAKSQNLSQEDTEKLLQFGKTFSLISEAQLPTIGAYLGGIVAQQAIKALTNKYMPIKQFFTFHLNEMMQKIPEKQQNYEPLHVKKQQEFRSLKIVVGYEGATKIEELKTFVIGAGAIGCELLKNFAMINMGAKGQIVVTDPDHIETSNLSRQFLFRDKHVKKAKSATACATLLQLNHRLQGHIVAKLDKVCEQTEQIYSNQFFKSRTLVANALDNVKARQYMDKRCVENKIPLFESGTLGPKGHVQVIVPFKTQNYGSQNDPNEQAQIPHCTLKMFPEETVHCIEWARDIFGKIFTLNPKALKKVIASKDLKCLQGQERQSVARMIKYRPESFDDCIAESVRKFYVSFRNNVRQLLFTYPIDLKTKEGKPFWQLPKRPPNQIHELDQNDEAHRTFISAYSVLLAKTYSIPYPKDFRKADGKAKIMQIAKKVKVEEFIPSEETSKEIQKEVQKENSGNPTEEVAQPQSAQKTLSEQIQLTEDVLQIQAIPQQFEKDQDSNGHIDLIYSMSNLRCKNYGLNECTWIEAKLKAGKIMAALSTTTSVVAALQTIEIIKLAIGGVIWRNAFINLAVPLIQISEPGPAAKYKIGNTQFSVWEDWNFKCSTLKELLAQIKDKYEVEGFNISTNQGKPVYWQAMYKDKQESKEALLNGKLKDLFNATQIQLSIALRKPEGGDIYPNVPKIFVEIIQQ